MTSKINIIIPACLISILVSLAFYNIAYADDEVWRESNNLYNQQSWVSEPSSSHTAYRLFLLTKESSLQGGKKYSFAFDKKIDIPSTATLEISVDGKTNYSYPGNVEVFSFTLPENYQYVQIFLDSQERIDPSQVTKIMLNVGDPLPYEPYYSGFRFDFSAIASMIGQYVQPVLTTILPYIFVMIALIIGISAGLRVFRKTAT